MKRALLVLMLLFSATAPTWAGGGGRMPAPRPPQLETVRMQLSGLT